ncbi:TetR/AcrR family transcriptional regulator [Mycobacterium asiaticum]|uniref:TetR family transcriptional regulator n=3 Tax=Mycobacterium asiaticum TaxID=1790 RepID=A0A1A3KA84_MYCAS|nr:TetR/AcrR family transcriptional regulator [Mycobacterium asiaticum]OBJ82032.1 TetR family transcriptional regulator [Mycobacterium asiaticum]
MTVGSQLGRPVGASGEQTRQRIIAAAMRCVAEMGYSQASIREIARTAGMTSGSLYHYFPNKAELFKATGDEIEAIVLPRLRAAAARSDDTAARLDAVLDESKQLMRDFPHLAAFLQATRVQSAGQSGRIGPTYPGSKALRDVVTEIIEDARRRGTLSCDATPAVESICALTRGLSEQAARLPREGYDATLDSVKQMIRGTLFARTGG